MIPRQYVHDIIQRSGQLDAVWILLELDIIEVSIPGVFTFIPSVGCFLSLLRGSKMFTADLLGVTEVRDLCNAQILFVLCNQCIAVFIHLDALIYILYSIPLINVFDNMGRGGKTIRARRREENCQRRKKMIYRRSTRAKANC